MPGGLTKAYTYDNAGNATQLTYTRTSGCSTGCVWVTNTAAYNIHGQMVDQGGLPTQAGAQASQQYAYDELGRLTETRDTSAGQCTVRQYVLDDNSNRTNMKTFAPGSGGTCNPGGTPTNRTRSYDNADRITHAGYTYDAFGRTTTVPNADAGGTGDMTATYFVNDLAHSVTQNGLTQTIDLDPNQRMNTKVKSGSSSGTETYAYADDTDSPVWIQNGSAWTRYVDGIDGTVAAIQPSSGSARWTISDIRGDMIAEATTGGLQNAREIDEFGVVKNNLPTSRPYGFHGSKQREVLTSGGTIAMGVRLYAPRSGRFLQVDPVLGGTDGPYEYPSDPVNKHDLNGKAAGLISKVVTEAVKLVLRTPVGRKYAIKALLKTLPWAFRQVGVGAARFMIKRLRKIKIPADVRRKIAREALDDLGSFGRGMNGMPKGKFNKGPIRIWN